MRIYERGNIWQDLKKYPDIKSGDKVGKLTVIEQANDAVLCRDKKWTCLCECGNTTTVDDARLEAGITKSCGCLREITTKRLKTQHGYTRSRLYAIWSGMKARCYNKNKINYARYGGKGITICEEWLHDFSKFKDWSLSHGYDDSLTIDRIDSTKGYSPDNCRWADIYTQANNKSRNIYITYHGERHTVAEWSRIIPIGYATIKKRYQSGWSVEDIFEKPIRRREA